MALEEVRSVLLNGNGLSRSNLQSESHGMHNFVFANIGQFGQV